VYHHWVMAQPKRAAGKNFIALDIIGGLFAEKRRIIYNYKRILVVLVEKLQNRIQGGKW